VRELPADVAEVHDLYPAAARRPKAAE